MKLILALVLLAVLGFTLAACEIQLTRLRSGSVTVTRTSK